MPSLRPVSKIERASLTASRSFLSNTRRLRKGTISVPRFRILANKFLKARAARESSRATPRARASKTPVTRRETSVSARRSALTEKAKAKEELLKAKAELEEKERLAKAKGAKARKEGRVAAAAAAERAEREFKSSLDELSDVLHRFSIGTAHTRRGNPWQRRSLSPIAEGGRRRSRRRRGL
jgi:membrane protein involved in colicin uptake